MGRTKENKAMVISNLKELLDEAELSFVIDYQGLTVAEITDLRNRLRSSGAICKVTKNTFMEKAVIGSEKWKPITSFLNGSSAFILVKEDLGGAIKAYQAFKKETKKTAFRGGVMQGQTLNEEQVKAIAANLNCLWVPLIAASCNCYYFDTVVCFLFFCSVVPF